MVLIGATAPSIRDVFYTPFSRSLNSPPSTFYGVEIQANIASHLVSAVLDKRTIIQTLPNLIDGFLGVYNCYFTMGVTFRVKLPKTECNAS